MHVSDIIETPTRDILGLSKAGVELSVENSTAAEESVRTGRADLAIVAVPHGAELPADLNCVPFAFEVATIVVNNANPLEKTDLVTLTAALAEETLDGGKWSVFGMKDTWADRNLLLYLPDSSFGITLPLLRSRTVLHGAIQRSVVFTNRKDNLDVLMREQPTCLMVVRGLTIPQNAHALQIAEKPGKDSFAYPPLESNVFYGDYPLRLPFYIVTRKDAPKAVADFETLLLSDAAAEKLAAAGYVPVPKSERDNGE